MSALYDRDAIRAWDAFTIENEPIRSVDLMERAATAATKKILGHYYFEKVAIICGKGNNGGDGLVIARLLAKRGKDVTVFVCDYQDEGSLDFEYNFELLPDTVDVKRVNGTDVEFPLVDLFIDCLFGSGLNRPIEGWLGDIINAVNATKTPIVAIDVPSGLYVNDNANNPLENVILAHRTLSFQTPKLPFFFAEYEPFVGKFSVLDIGLHPDFTTKKLGEYIERDLAQLRYYNQFAHKGQKGFLTLIGGMQNMSGAVLLSAEAAFKCGLGYVSVVSDTSTYTPLMVRLPEALFHDQDNDHLPTKTTAIAIGPGLGQGADALRHLEKALETNQPLVIDADGINLLAAHPELQEKLPLHTILTPHIGELKRLIGASQHPEILLWKQAEFCKKHGIYILQKGAYSKLTTPEGNLFINATGNSAMGTAGMGDALTGMIGAFLAQGYTPQQAAINGMYYHGLAGDLVVRESGHFGVTTSTVIQAIPRALNGR